METVGVRELKNRLSEVLRRVAEGALITVTDRGRPIAVLAPAQRSAQGDLGRQLVRDGLASWSGGKPRGGTRRPRVRGVPLSTTVIEERR